MIYIKACLWGFLMLFLGIVALIAFFVFRTIQTVPGPGGMPVGGVSIDVVSLFSSPVILLGAILCFALGFYKSYRRQQLRTTNRKSS